jgi:inorganic pyrophosphatase
LPIAKELIKRRVGYPGEKSIYKRFETHLDNIAFARSNTSYAYTVQEKIRLNTQSMIITAIVETPKGQGLKFDFDPLLGCMKLNKIMPLGLVFPFDFGYIPGTIGGDGDPIDVLIISEIPTFPGCAIDCRIIGGIKANQQERDGEKMRNDRIIAIPEVSIQYAAVKTLNELPSSLMEQVIAFFENYNAQAGKIFSPVQKLTPTQAGNIIKKARSENKEDLQVQLFLPLLDPEGQLFAEKNFSDLASELKENFGGVTVYSHTPATGQWKQENGKTVGDNLLVYEVLLSNPDKKYWVKLKARLEKQFRQQELLVLITKVQKL